MNQDSLRADSSLKRTLLGYVPRSSPAYVFHPFTRMAVLLVLSFLPLFVLDVRVNGILFGLVLVLFPICRIPLRVFKVYLPVFLVLFLALGTVYGLVPDPEHAQTILWSGGGVTIYQEAVWMASRVYLRIVAVLALTVFFFHIMTEREIVLALRWAGLPFVVCYVMGIAFRGIGMFLDDLRTVRTAEQARGFGLRQVPVWKRPFRAIYYVIPLMALMIRRTDDVATAVHSRGFEVSGFDRTSLALRRFTFRWYDLLTIVLVIIGTVWLSYRYFELAL